MNESLPTSVGSSKIDGGPSPPAAEKKRSNKPSNKSIYFSLAILLIIVLVVSGLLVLIGVDEYNRNRAATPEGTVPPSLIKNPWIIGGIVTAVLGAAAVFFASSSYTAAQRPSGLLTGDDKGASGSESVSTQLEKLVHFAEQLGQSAQRLGQTVRQTKSAFETNAPPTPSTPVPPPALALVRSREGEEEDIGQSTEE